MVVQPSTDAPSGPSCAPKRIGLDYRGVTNGNDASVPTCGVDKAGHVVLDYNIAAPCLIPEPFRGCLVTSHQDLVGFLQGRGLFAIDVCVDGTLDGELNLYVEDSVGKDLAPEGRFNLPLVSTSETFGSSCRRRWFSAADLSPPRFCAARQGAALASCIDAGAVETPLEASFHIDGGPFTFVNSDLALISEHCASGRPPDAGSGHVTATLMSAVYFPDECTCTQDSDCDPGGFCSRDGWPDLACCWCSTCRGVCSQNLSP